MSRLLFKGEKRYVGMTVSRASGTAFTIQSATYNVLNSAGTSVDTGSASVTDDTVFCLLDTTQVDMPAGCYKVWFSVVITGLSKVLMDYVTVEVQ